MHWIVQKDMYEPEQHEALLGALSRLGIPHTEVKLLPLSGHLPPLHRLEPYVAPLGPVMVCGTVNLSLLARELAWVPGSFYNENHDYRVWSRHYGRYLLNAGAVVCPLAEVTALWPRMFIRPCGDTKLFNGQVVGWDELKAWRRRLLSTTYTSLTGQDVVACSPARRIYREVRCFVVDGRVVTQSTYKLGGTLLPSPEVPPMMLAFAQRMARHWQPARAFVLDVALTDPEAADAAEEEGMKIVEVNCINCAGFYACDPQLFVQAIEQMAYSPIDTSSPGSTLGR